jgi:hypothetical protein
MMVVFLCSILSVFLCACVTGRSFIYRYYELLTFYDAISKWKVECGEMLEWRWE